MIYVVEALKFVIAISHGVVLARCNAIHLRGVVRPWLSRIAQTCSTLARLWGWINNPVAPNYHLRSARPKGVATETDAHGTPVWSGLPWRLDRDSWRGECLADKYKVAVSNEAFPMNGRWDVGVTLSMSNGGFLSTDWLISPRGHPQNKSRLLMHGRSTCRLAPLGRYRKQESWRYWPPCSRKWQPRTVWMHVIWQLRLSAVRFDYERSWSCLVFGLHARWQPCVDKMRLLN